MSFKEIRLRFMFSGISRNYWHLTWLSLAQLFAFVLGPLTFLSAQSANLIGYFFDKQDGSVLSRYKAKHTLKLMWSKFMCLYGVIWIFYPDALRQGSMREKLLTFLKILYVDMEIALSAFIILYIVIIVGARTFKKLRKKKFSFKEKISKASTKLKEPIDMN